jgi:hypothetical protein
MPLASLPPLPPRVLPQRSGAGSPPLPAARRDPASPQHPPPSPAEPPQWRSALLPPAPVPPRDGGGAQRYPRKQALHLYSGPRHPACISNQFSAQGWDCGDVDTKVEPEMFSSNDLATDDLWLEIKEAVETGQISAAHMGPECSTCSHARFNPPRIPRPIRSQQFPMGLPKAQLSQSEDLEVKTANYHYIQCISLGELLWEKGVPFSIEFPAKLGDYHVTLKDLPAAASF